MTTKTKRSVPARVRALTTLQGWIHDGALAPGSRLPSERVLAERLDADRATVRRAVDILIDQGLVREHTPRTRTVMPVNRPSALMQRTVAILTSVPGEVPAHRQEGWIDFIERGVSAAIRETTCHALFLHPGIISENGIADLVKGQPSGVLVTDAGAEWPEARQAATDLRLAGIPVVVYGERESWADFDRVVSDHREGARQLTSWLLGRGRRRVLQILPLEKGAWPLARREGYEAAMREAGLEPLPLVDMPDLDATCTPERFAVRTRTVAGYLATLSCLREVDAIMVASDGDLSPVAAACGLLGLDPRCDLDLVGYDNYWRECPEQRLAPIVPAATVDKRNRDIGRELVSLLMDRIEGRLPAEPQRRVVEPRLVEGSTSARATAGAGLEIEADMKEESR